MTCRSIMEEREDSNRNFAGFSQLSSIIWVTITIEKILPRRQYISRLIELFDRL